MKKKIMNEFLRLVFSSYYGYSNQDKIGTELKLIFNGKVTACWYSKNKIPNIPALETLESNMALKMTSLYVYKSKKAMSLKVELFSCLSCLKHCNCNATYFDFVIV